MDFLLKLFILVFPLCSQGRVLSSQRQARLSLAESAPTYFYNNIDGHPGTYSFGYDVNDPLTGNVQFRSEERYPNGTVVGSYGYVDSRGRPQRYRYIADHRGYRVMTDQPRIPVMTRPAVSSGEPSITWSRPKRPNKNKNNLNQYFTKLPVNKGNLVNRNELLPPSYYAAFD